jgi:hypothetical protein
MAVVAALMDEEEKATEPIDVDPSVVKAFVDAMLVPYVAKLEIDTAFIRYMNGLDGDTSRFRKALRVLFANRHANVPKFETRNKSSVNAYLLGNKVMTLK